MMVPDIPEQVKFQQLSFFLFFYTVRPTALVCVELVELTLSVGTQERVQRDKLCGNFFQLNYQTHHHIFYSQRETF